MIDLKFVQTKNKKYEIGHSQIFVQDWLTGARIQNTSPMCKYVSKMILVFDIDINLLGQIILYRAIIQDYNVPASVFSVLRAENRASRNFLALEKLGTQILCACRGSYDGDSWIICLISINFESIITLIRHLTCLWSCISLIQRLFHSLKMEI